MVLEGSQPGLLRTNPALFPFPHNRNLVTINQLSPRKNFVPIGSHSPNPQSPRHPLIFLSLQIQTLSGHARCFGHLANLTEAEPIVGAPGWNSSEVAFPRPAPRVTIGMPCLRVRQGSRPQEQGDPSHCPAMSKTMPVLDVPSEWKHTICGPLGLASFT